MCFIISSKQIINGKPKPDIATKDIEVVKFCDGPIKILWWTFYSSPMYRKLYRMGKIYRSVLKPSKNCYEYKSKKGLYSYNYEKSRRKFYFLSDKLFKAIIPKGSKYYISEDEIEYCSNKLKIIEEVRCV